jgi:hypothetical protein
MHQWRSDILCKYTNLLKSGTTFMLRVVLVRFLGTHPAAPPSGGTVYLAWRVGQSRIYAPHMTDYLVISLPKIPCIHRIYIYICVYT